MHAKWKWCWIWIIALTIFCFGTQPIKASIVQFDLDTQISGRGEPGGTAPWLTATLENYDANTVKLTMSAASLVGPENVSRWYFNFESEDAGVRDLRFQYAESSSGPEARWIGTREDRFRARGDGLFDILFAFPKRSDSFGADETVVYYISSIAEIQAGDFELGSTPRPEWGDSFFSAAKIGQFCGRGFHRWRANSIVGDQVPIPGAVWMLGSGLMGLIFIRRRSGQKYSK